ncbi:MAG: PPOX class F420-dependent oxidoreductase [Acidimicrobiia bacterium]|nr:PPOX class F420-dependent oxidoreductase [Acidimicrobiia bacterium]
MAIELSDAVKALIDETNMASLATIMKDGSPHVSTMWVGRRGDTLVMNTADGRVKVHNMRRDPRVAVSIHRDSNPYQNVLIRGRVTNLTDEGGVDGINQLAQKYRGTDYEWLRPGDVRLAFDIEPESVAERGL